MTYHIVEYSRNFEKQFKKLPEKSKQNFYKKLTMFKENPYEQVLKNHGLKGKYLGYRSITIENDLRALYTVRGDKIVLFAFTGSHGQLY